MRSAERRRTLARRLAWMLALTSMVGATIAIGAVLVVSDVLIRAHVERSAQDAARVMAAELDENPSLVPLVEEEARELGIDARVAVVRGDDVVAGDRTLGIALDDDCSTIEGAATDELVCGERLRTDEGLVVLAAVAGERVQGHRLPMLLAGLAALAVVVVGSALSGLRLAKRFLAPLDRLRQTVADVDASAPGAVELPAPTGLEELDALRTTLSSLLVRLDAELSRARRFAAHAAHELRTPLARMLAELELAVEVAGSSQDADTLTKVQRSTERLIVLTERLLLLATPHEALAAAQATSMSQLVEELPTRRSPAEAARLVLATDASDGLVRGDSVLLGVLLDNVVDNALKFSSGLVHVTVLVHGDDVIVEVADQGPGLPDDQADLFEPFRRGARVAHLPGHGLGLALVAHIARACGGKAWFRPGRSVGACLCVQLPAVRPATSGSTAA